MTSLPAQLPERRVLRRPRHGRIVAGVASGLGQYFGRNSWLIRALLVILGFFYGLGILAYVVLWMLTPRVEAPSQAIGIETATRRGMRPAEVVPPQKADSGLLVALGMVFIGVLWLFSPDSEIPAELFWPLVTGGAGVLVIWLHVDEYVALPKEQSGPWWGNVTRGGGVMSIVRLVGGLILVAAGISWILATQIGLRQLPGVLGASAVLLGGVLVVAAPWLYQQRNRIKKADEERVRAQARADMAAHLHDSVLQTLALIQRQAHDPVTVASLARKQERELRTWLYGETTRAASLRSALSQVCQDVESRFPIDVELVCVGDAQVNDRIEALVMAVQESVTNAAKHSGVARVDVYAEVEDGKVEVFVRDRGKGFDPDQVPSDRMGVRESITARMQRYGGTATIRSAPGEGTEVRIEIQS